MTTDTPAKPFRRQHQWYGLDDVVESELYEEILQADLRHIEDAAWRTDAPDLSPLDEPTWSWQKGRTLLALFRAPGLARLVRLEHGNIIATVAASTRAVAAAAMQELREALGQADDEETHTIPVRFWAMSPNGPISVTRRLDTPAWDAIAENYSGRVRESLADTAGPGFRRGHGGRLLLWHGEPGTGKTWAIRALAWEWREWCDIEYVVDPEKFFGSESAYLVQVLLQGEDDRPVEVGAEAPQPRWRLLVMEDTGELLTVDAAERAGKRLSRFLNVVDGFIGQGLRVLVLLTTNEHIEKLHPAVARPGRTAVEVPFGRLNVAESTQWAQGRGVEVERRPHTLAELYAVLEARPRLQAVREVGFGRAAS